MPDNVPIFREDGLVVGHVHGDILYKSVKKSKHFLRLPQAWAWDLTCIEQAEALGATKVEIMDIENNDLYITTIAKFREKGRLFDRQNGKQIFLTLVFWQKKSMAEKEEVNQEKQERLF